MKIFTLGKGFVADHLPYSKLDARLDMSAKQLEYIINTQKPDVLINCVGKTGKPNVDWCETHKEETSTINTALPIILAEACGKHDIHLVQIGSGCIYFGKSPHLSPYLTEHPANTIKPGEPNYFYGAFELADSGWKETDLANPQSHYSKTKYACDLAIGELPHVTTLRIRMPISEKDTPRNLINKLRGYTRVIDTLNSMTFMTDFTRCVEWVIKEGQTGIFHVTNPETLSPARIMTEYQKYVPSHNFTVIHEEDLGKLTIAKRSNCTLDNSKLTNAGFRMTPAHEALQQCMKNYMDKQHV